MRRYYYLHGAFERWILMTDDSIQRERSSSQRRPLTRKTYSMMPIVRNSVSPDAS